MGSNNVFYAKFTDGGLEIIDDSLLSKISSKNISASLVNGLLQCPAQWAGNNFLSNFVPQDEDNAMTRGSFFHRIMEHFFALEQDNRFVSEMPNIFRRVLAEKEFKHFAGNEDALAWAKTAVKNYFSMSGEPTRVSIADYKGAGGLEVRIFGHVEGVERPFHGFIDRLSYDRDGNYIIDDWKTGASAKKYDPGDKYESGWPEARQQILYAYIINSQNSVDSSVPKVSKARLIFPVAKDVVNVDINNKAYIEKAIGETAEAEKVLNNCSDSGVFPYNPSFLCHWCPLVKACPGAMSPVLSVEKAAVAYNSQPSVEVLGEGIVLK